jgi:hypothetical protein
LSGIQPPERKLRGVAFHFPINERTAILADCSQEVSLWFDVGYLGQRLNN